MHILVNNIDVLTDYPIQDVVQLMEKLCIPIIHTCVIQLLKSNKLDF